MFPSAKQNNSFEHVFASRTYNEHNNWQTNHAHAEGKALGDRVC